MERCALGRAGRMAPSRFTETIIRAPVGERAGGFVLGLKTSTLMALGRQFCLRA